MNLVLLLEKILSDAGVSSFEELPSDLQREYLSLSSLSGDINKLYIIKLQAISNLAGNVLPNIESGGLRAVTDFLKDPQTTNCN